MITKKQFFAQFGSRIVRADKGRGIAVVDTVSYRGCVVVGEYRAYPLSAWLACLRPGEDATYAVTERMDVRINGSVFGRKVWGATGTYTVR